MTQKGESSGACPVPEPGFKDYPPRGIRKKKPSPNIERHGWTREQGQNEKDNSGGNGGDAQLRRQAAADTSYQAIRTPPEIGSSDDAEELVHGFSLLFRFPIVTSTSHPLPAACRCNSSEGSQPGSVTKGRRSRWSPFTSRSLC